MKSRNIHEELISLQNRYENGNAFTRGELNRLVRDRQLTPFLGKIFHGEKGKPTLQEMFLMDHTKTESEWEDNIAEGIELPKEDVLFLSRRFPKVFMSYLLKHKDEDTFKIENWIYNMSKEEWEEYAQSPVLYRNHPVDEKLHRLMRKAINMQDKKLYDHIKGLGIDPLDKDNEWYDRFSKKQRKLAWWLNENGGDYKMVHHTSWSGEYPYAKTISVDA